MKNLPQSLIALVLLLGCLACSPESTSSEVDTPTSSVQTGLEINIQSGPIQGTIIENTRVFYGIPYAEDNAMIAAEFAGVSGAAVSGEKFPPPPHPKVERAENEGRAQVAHLGGALRHFDLGGPRGPGAPPA